ncbi:uncharacterized protein LOC123466514 isoform X2 [Daphnia magna]|uniref:uncharacterized protein LOC123466514 isoform X2 n=1 Tax=Daphnia magna TaxID=35525 RepID=UPI001E1BA53C|nr:uncharacterized protein LOC123466514 isoform X2 [Daphnia magna]
MQLQRDKCRMIESQLTVKDEKPASLVSQTVGEMKINQADYRPFVVTFGSHQPSPILTLPLNVPVAAAVFLSQGTILANSDPSTLQIIKPKPNENPPTVEGSKMSSPVSSVIPIPSTFPIAEPTAGAVHVEQSRNDHTTTEYVENSEHAHLLPSPCFVPNPLEGKKSPYPKIIRRSFQPAYASLSIGGTPLLTSELTVASFGNMRDVNAYVDFNIDIHMSTDTTKTCKLVEGVENALSAMPPLIPIVMDEELFLANHSSFPDKCPNGNRQPNVDANSPSTEPSLVNELETHSNQFGPGELQLLLSPPSAGQDKSRNHPPAASPSKIASPPTLPTPGPTNLSLLLQQPNRLPHRMILQSKKKKENKKRDGRTSQCLCNIKGHFSKKLSPKKGIRYCINPAM